MSEIWTPPGNWTSGEVDSGRFNDEIPGNIRYLYAALPRVYQVGVSGGPTSGTTELVVATLVVPEQPVDTIQLPSAMFNGIPDNAGADDRWLARIRDTNTGGTERAATFADRIGGPTSTQVRFQFPMPVGQARTVPANTTATYVVTVTRSTGDGTLTSIILGRAQVLVIPDLS